jgi:predicted membrane chloride channel (bestrophin family)
MQTRTQQDTRYRFYFVLYSHTPLTTNTNMERRVKFDATDHLRTITQLHGSVWPSVLPFCALNCFNLLIVALLKKYYIPALKITEGDFTSSLSIIVAFLSVTRVTISFNDYISHRNGLQQIARSARGLVFHSVAFTRGDSSPSAKEWRFTIARETIALLKLMVSGEYLP